MSVCVRVGDTMSDKIQHYGVKGMKWGVRRYQPYPKGSRNAGKFMDIQKQAGDRKISVSSGIRSKGREITMARAQREIKNLSTSDAKKVVSRAQLENRFKKLTQTPNVGLNRKNIGEYLNRDTMGNEELSRKVERLQLADNMRQEARSVNPEIISIGKKAAAIATPFVVREVFKRLDGTEFSAEQLADMGKQASELAAKWII